MFDLRVGVGRGWGLEGHHDEEIRAKNGDLDAGATTGKNQGSAPGVSPGSRICGTARSWWPYQATTTPRVCDTTIS